jgi:hypothetical protein
VWSGSLYFHENRPWDDNIGLFCLKISCDVARAFLMEAALTALPPDFWNIGNDTNHEVGSPFHHFGYFFVFNRFDNIMGSNDWQGLDPVGVVDQQFYSYQLFAALTSARMKFSTSVIARIGGGTLTGSDG